jgi:biopolymer transport protein ExbD
METNPAADCAAGFAQKVTRFPALLVAHALFLFPALSLGAAGAQDKASKPPARVQLPQVPVAGQVQPGPNRLEVLSIGPFVGVLVDGQPVPVEDGAGALESKIRSLAEARGCRPKDVLVVVHGDKSTKVESVFALLETVQKTGATSFRLTAMAEAIYLADATVRAGRSMGEFRARSAPAAPAEGLPVPDGLPPIRVRLRAGADGRLVAVAFGNRQIPADLRRLGPTLRELVGSEPDPERWRAVEVELDCDGRLRYEHVMRAVSVVFGHLDADARFRRLAGQVTLMTRREHAWQVALGPADSSGRGERSESGEAAGREAVPIETAELPKSPPEPAYPILLQLKENRDVVLAGTVVSAGKDGKLDEQRLRALLTREKEVMVRQGTSAAEATIIIRADLRATTGSVQQLIRICQNVGFDKFALRAWRPNQTEGTGGTKEAGP